VAHLVSCGRPQAAEALLTDFAYGMARLKSENGPGARPLAQDAGAVQEASGLEDGEAFRTWEDFLRTRVHILVRGDANWGAEKILLQLAVERIGNISPKPSLFEGHRSAQTAVHGHTDE
jgi:hypothetical protein